MPFRPPPRGPHSVSSSLREAPTHSVVVHCVHIAAIRQKPGRPRFIISSLIETKCPDDMLRQPALLRSSFTAARRMMSRRPIVGGNWKCNPASASKLPELIANINACDTSKQAHASSNAGASSARPSTWIAPASAPGVRATRSASCPCPPHLPKKNSAPAILWQVRRLRVPVAAPRPAVHGQVHQRGGDRPAELQLHGDALSAVPSLDTTAHSTPP